MVGEHIDDSDAAHGFGQIAHQKSVISPPNLVVLPFDIQIPPLRSVEYVESSLGVDVFLRTHFRPVREPIADVLPSMLYQSFAHFTFYILLNSLAHIDHTIEHHHPTVTCHVVSTHIQSCVVSLLL